MSDKTMYRNKIDLITATIAIIENYLNPDALPESIIQSTLEELKALRLSWIHNNIHKDTIK